MEELYHQIARLEKQIERGDMPCQERARLEQRRRELIAELEGLSEWVALATTRPGVLP